MKTCEDCENWKHWGDNEVQSDEFGECLVRFDEDKKPIVTFCNDICGILTPNDIHEARSKTKGEL